METTYLYYPARKVHKILSTFELDKMGYKTVFSDAEELSVVLSRKLLFSKKKFFEVRVSPTKENISSVSVSEIYSDHPDPAREKEVIQAILKIF
jgi:hypothetical protein